jgi:hypothetical protein
LALLSSLLFAAIVGIIFVWLYSFVSPQRLIKRTKQKIWASVYEAVLFQHDAGTSFRAYWRMLTSGLFYLALALGPIAILILPSLWILSSGYSYLGQDGFKAKTAVLISGKVSPEELKSVSIQASSGVQLSPLVRKTKEGEFFATMTTTEEGEASLDVSIGGVSREHITFGVGSSGKVQPASKILSLPFPEREFSLFGCAVSWLTLVIVVMLLTGYIFARAAKIEV